MGHRSTAWTPPRRRWMVRFAAAALLCLAPLAAALAQTSPPTAKPVFALTRVVFDLPRGARYAVQQGGLLCVTEKTSVWKGEPVVYEAAGYRRAFRTALQGEGLAARGDDTDLFEGATEGTDFSVGALVGDYHVRACLTHDFGSPLTHVRGNADMRVEWQVFSRSLHQVVARVATEAAIAQRAAIPGDADQLAELVFAANARRLAHDAEFLRAVGMARAPTPAGAPASP